MVISEHCHQSPWDAFNILNHVHCPSKALLKKNDILQIKDQNLLDLQCHRPSNASSLVTWSCQGNSSPPVNPFRHEISVPSATKALTLTCSRHDEHSSSEVQLPRPE